MLTPPLVGRLEAALRHLEFGAVHLVIHDGKVVRIERIERVRLPDATGASQAGLTESSEAPPQPSGRPTAPPEARRDAQE